MQLAALQGGWPLADVASVVAAVLADASVGVGDSEITHEVQPREQVEVELLQQQLHIVMALQHAINLCQKQ